MQPIVEKFISQGQVTEAKKENLPEGVLCRAKYHICSIGEKNRNNRVYEKAVWEKVLGDDDIQQKLKNRALFFHAEHPTTTQSNTEKVAGIVTGIELNEKKNIVLAEMEVLDTPYGRIVDTLLKAKCGIGVSTRADGELEEALDETGNKFSRVIPESYRFVTIDFTADPSTYGSEIPLDVERNVVGVMKNDLDNETLDRQYATCLLEKFTSPEAKAILESIKNDKGHKGCKKKATEKDCGACAKAVESVQKKFDLQEEKDRVEKQMGHSGAPKAQWNLKRESVEDVKPESKAKEYGDKLKVDWNVIEPSQFEDGFKHELEHKATVGGDEFTIAKIALDHLKEDPEYYVKLKKVEAVPTKEAVEEPKAEVYKLRGHNVLIKNKDGKFLAVVNGETVGTYDNVQDARLGAGGFTLKLNKQMGGMKSESTVEESMPDWFTTGGPFVVIPKGGRFYIVPQNTPEAELVPENDKYSWSENEEGANQLKDWYNTQIRQRIAKTETTHWDMQDVFGKDEPAPKKKKYTTSADKTGQPANSKSGEEIVKKSEEHNKKQDENVDTNVDKMARFLNHNKETFEANGGAVESLQTIFKLNESEALKKVEEVFGKKVEAPSLRKLASDIDSLVSEKKKILEDYTNDIVKLQNEITEWKKVVASTNVRFSKLAEDYKKLEESSKKMNEASTALRNLELEGSKKHLEEATKEFEGKIGKLKLEYEKMICEMKEAHNKDLVKTYVRIKTKSMGLKLQEKTLTLLESCNNIAEVDATVKQVQDAIREGRVQSATLSEIVVNAPVEVDPVQKGIDNRIANVFKSFGI